VGYSPAFEALPAAVKDRVMAKIDRVLAGEETGKKYSHLTPEIRQAIAEILKSTLP